MAMIDTRIVNATIDGISYPTSGGLPTGGGALSSPFRTDDFHLANSLNLKYNELTKGYSYNDYCYGCGLLDMERLPDTIVATFDRQTFTVTYAVPWAKTAKQFKEMGVI